MVRLSGGAVPTIRPDDHPQNRRFCVTSLLRGRSLTISKWRRSHPRGCRRRLVRDKSSEHWTRGRHSGGSATGGSGMRRWVVPVLVTLVTISAALPAKSVDRVKRADETVMFGNQQNLAHKSVKKSGPPPLYSKLAEKKAEVMESHKEAEDDPVSELDSMMAGKPSDSDLESDLHTLVSHGDAEADAPMIAEERKEPGEEPGDKKKREDKNLGEKPKRQARQRSAHKKLSFQQFIKKFGPETFTLDAGRPSHRSKRAVVSSRSSDLSPTNLQRLRRDLSKMASESHMAASAQRRKKRDTDVDPNQLAMLEYLLARSNDGYDAPEEVVDPSYEEEEDPEEYDPRPREEFIDMPERRGMLDDYSRYAVAKRVPDLDEEGPAEVEEVPEAPEEEDPVSVYESEYGPVTYGLIEHEGVPGLFVPLEQESMRRLLRAEKEERDSERARLKTLATILSLNQKRRK